MKNKRTKRGVYTLLAFALLCAAALIHTGSSEAAGKEVYLDTWETAPITSDAGYSSATLRKRMPNVTKPDDFVNGRYPGRFNFLSLTIECVEGDAAGQSFANQWPDKKGLYHIKYGEVYTPGSPQYGLTGGEFVIVEHGSGDIKYENKIVAPNNDPNWRAPYASLINNTNTSSSVNVDFFYSGRSGTSYFESAMPPNEIGAYTVKAKVGNDKAQFLRGYERTKNFIVTRKYDVKYIGMPNDPAAPSTNLNGGGYTAPASYERGPEGVPDEWRNNEILLPTAGQMMIPNNKRFDGWYSDPSYQHRVTKISPSEKGNKTFYAKYTDMYTIKVSSDNHGDAAVYTHFPSKTDSFNSKAQKIPAGTKLYLRARPTSASYRFNRWDLGGATLGQKVSIPNDYNSTTYEFTMPARDVQAKASFITDQPTHRIRVHINDSTLGEVTGYPDEEIFIEPVHMTVTPKNGAEFIGWTWDHSAPFAAQFHLRYGDSQTGAEYPANGNLSGKYNFLMPNYDVEITANFERPKKNVKVRAEGGGKVSLEAEDGGVAAFDISASLDVPIGKKVTIKTQPNQGFSFEGFQNIDPAALNIQPDTAGNYTFIMPNQDTSMKAVFSETKYKLFVGSDGHAKEVHAKNAAGVDVQEAKQGEQITLSQTPNVNWTFDHWEIEEADENGNPTTPANDLTSLLQNGTFTMPDKHLRITARYIENTPDQTAKHALTVQTESRGGATNEEGGIAYIGTDKSLKNIDAYEGEEISVFAEPREGWEIASWKIDGVDTGASQSPYAVTMGGADITATVIFQKKSYSLTVQARPSEGGRVTKSLAGDTAFMDAQITLTPEANAGWRFVRWEVSSNKPVFITANKFSMPAADVVITGIFEKNDYSVTVNAVGGGVASADKALAQLGDEVSLSASASADSRFYRFEVVSGNVAINDPTNPNASFIMGTENVEINAIFLDTSTFGIDIEAIPQQGGNPTASPRTSEADREITLKAAPNEGFRFVEWRDINQNVNFDYNGGSSGKENTSFLMPSGDVHLQAVYEQIPVDYKITWRIEGKGKVRKDKQKARAGETVSLHAEDDPAYANWHFKEWKLTPSSAVPADKSKRDTSFSMPAEDTTVTAVFAKASSPNPPHTDKGADGAPKKKAVSPKTGDNSDFIVWFALLGAAVGAAAGVIIYKYKKRKK